MKKKITLALFITLSVFSFSQTEEYTCLIDRNDFKNIFVANENDTLFLCENEKYISVVNESKVTYKYVYGKGWKKGSNGVRERRKRYLVNSLQDTLLYTANGNSLIQFNDSTTVRRVKTDYGWSYIKNDSTILCELDFTWNESFWSYKLQFINTNKNTDKLKKVVMLSLVEMASERSKIKCEEEDVLNNIYYILWASSLIKK